jgi:hypothetical protein
MGNVSFGVDAFPPTGGGGSSTLSTSFLSAYYGLGFDGDVTVSSTVTLTRNMQYNSLIITGSGRLKPAGFRICVKGALTIDAGGSIDDDGPANPTPGTTGAGLASRGIYGPLATAGRDGVTVTGAGSSVVSGLSNASLNNTGVLPLGGAGGASGLGQAGGAAGAATVPATAQDWTLNSILNMGRQTGPGTFGGGTGGGSGGCNTTGGTCTSGAGGCGGGAVMVYAATLTNNGRISANGTTGGAAAITGTANGGGGGGGGGGLVFLQTSTSTGTGTVQALGGSGGAGAGTSGVAGSGGTQGCVVELVTA